MMFPVASLFALKTHFKPTTFTPLGTLTTSQVPASFSIFNFSSIAFSHKVQSGRLFTSVRFCGSKASFSLANFCYKYVFFFTTCGSGPLQCMAVTSLNITVKILVTNLDYLTAMHHNGQLPQVICL